MNRIFAVIIGFGLLPCFFNEPTFAQPPSQAPGFQQQLKQGFNQAKHRVAHLFGRPQKTQPMSINRRDQPAQHQRSRHHVPPYRQTMHANQRPQQYPVGQSQQPRHAEFDHPAPRFQDRNFAAQAGYLQQPQPDANTQGLDPSYGNPPEEYSPPRQSAPTPNPFPNSNQLRMPPGNPQPNAPNGDGWNTQSTSNYQNYLRSGGPVSNKPQTMEFYNQRQFRHFSDRISATERAILLEDELANIREVKNTLESKIRSLEARLKQRDFEIEQLQTAVNDAIEQLSSASNRHRQLQEQVRVVTTQRNQEKASYEKLLDELRRQLNELLANELIGNG